MSGLSEYFQKQYINVFKPCMYYKYSATPVHLQSSEAL